MAGGDRWEIGLGLGLGLSLGLSLGLGLGLSLGLSLGLGLGLGPGLGLLGPSPARLQPRTEAWGGCRAEGLGCTWKMASGERSCSM